MTLNCKVSAPVLRIKALEDTGEITGYASTFGGEPDSYGEIVAPGAFKDSLAEHKRKKTMPKMFWQHQSAEPIGRWTSATEDDLGLLVTGKLNMGVQRGAEAYELLKAGDIDGLSIGYRTRKHSEDSETEVWTLEKVDLFEVSVVSIGANENATIEAVKAQKRDIAKTEALIAKVAAGDRLTEREFEDLAKGTWQLSNSQAERAARVHLKGQGEPAEADEVLTFLRTLSA